MKIVELENIVLIETLCLLLIVLIIFSAVKRWRKTLITSCVMATIAFFSAWGNIMAFGSVLVYGSASTLLWWQLDRSNTKSYNRSLHTLMWAILAIGVTVLILNNIHYIYLYLRRP